MNINEVRLAGNLTRDPELKYTTRGTAVCDVDIAVNEFFKNPDGDGYKQKTVFVNGITFWGNQAEAVAKHFHKGKAIYITGRIKLDEWDDKETGKKRSKIGVTGDGFQFVGGKSDGSGQQHNSTKAPRTESPKSSGPSTVNEEEDDDVPF